MKGDFGIAATQKKDAVRNQILRVLAKEHPLSLMNIHRRIARNFGARVSFQATSKAANALVEGGVLERGAKKEYAISRKWILDSKKFFDSLVSSYGTKANAKVFNRLFHDQDYAEYRLNSLFELDNFWADLLIYFADSLSEKERAERAYFYNNLGWWFLINYGSEVSLFQYYRKKGITGCIAFPDRNFINMIAVQNYRSTGHMSKIIGERPFSESMDLNVVGSNIIQVFYPENILGKLKKLVAGHKSAKDVGVEELNGLINTKADIRMVVLKNPEIARSYKKQMEKYF